jgi:hypothetical protein
LRWWVFRWIHLAQLRGMYYVVYYIARRSWWPAASLLGRPSASQEESQGVPPFFSLLLIAMKRERVGNVVPELSADIYITFITSLAI